jgi:hypothetical protein
LILLFVILVIDMREHILLLIVRSDRFVSSIEESLAGSVFVA